MSSLFSRFPIILFTTYFLAYLISDTYFYNQIFETLTKIDTYLFILSTIGVIFFFNRWSIVSVYCYCLVLSLNMLTEISFRTEIINYHLIYQIVLMKGIVLMAILSKIRK